MPTYVVSAAKGRLTPAAKRSVADAITGAHSKATGAQRFFAQVIFREVDAGDVFIGGKLAHEGQLFVHGHVRSRPPELMRSLIAELTDALAHATGADRQLIWVYVSELPPSMMVEFGKVLPEPGEENRWLDDMSSGEREYLEKVGY